MKTLVCTGPFFLISFFMCRLAQLLNVRLLTTKEEVTIYQDLLIFALVLVLTNIKIWTSIHIYV